MAELIWSIIAVAGGILLIVVILWSLATGRGDRDRDGEDVVREEGGARHEGRQGA